MALQACFQGGVRMNLKQLGKYEFWSTISGIVWCSIFKITGIQVWSSLLLTWILTFWYWLGKYGE